MDNTPLKVGDNAPEFELMNQDKTKIKLSDLLGKKVVLLFYPMDFSGVCTTELCAFSAGIATIQKDANTVVYGINADHPFSHDAFKKQHKLGYDLLSDPTRKTLKAYGMWAGEEPYNCSKRGEVVIGKDGKIAAWQEVPMKDPRTAEQVAKVAGA
jgi:peroxiredoxin